MAYIQRSPLRSERGGNQIEVPYNVEMQHEVECLPRGLGPIRGHAFNSLGVAKVGGLHPPPFAGIYPPPQTTTDPKILTQKTIPQKSDSSIILGNVKWGVTSQKV